MNYISVLIKKTFSYEINNSMGKKCSKCEVEKDVSNFGKCKNVKSGLYPSCNECRSNYRKNNTELLKVKNKEYYESVKDTDKYQNTQQEYYLKNRTKKIQYATDYYTLNKETVIKRQNDWVKRKCQLDPSFRLTHKLRRTIRRTLQNKTSRSINYFGVTDSSELLKILTDKCDNKNWQNDGYHVDHIWQIHWFEESLKTDPEKVSKIIHNHKNLRPIPSSENLNRLKLDFSPLLEEDLIIYQDFLNPDILDKIKSSFSN